MSFYLGSEPVPQAILRKESTTLTAGQTVISTGGYSNGDLIQVSLNGVIIEGAGVDYTATNGSDITLTVAGSAGDVLQFQTFDAFELVGSKFSAPTITNDVTLKNDTEEDTDGGRSSKLVYKGEQSGGEISTLAEIEAGHDGALDDEKGSLSFKTNDGSDGSTPTTALTINSEQKIGIGTDNPAYTLTVEKDVDDWVSRIYNTGSDANAQGVLIRTDATAAHDTTALGVYADSAYKMVVKSTGNVGISESNPQQDLHITSSSGGTIRLARDDTAVSTDDVHGSIEFHQNDPSQHGAGVVSKIESINESTFAGHGSIAISTGTATTLTERWRFTSDGHLKAAADGNGIDFSATEGSGASSSVFDDYEEGTWTPYLARWSGGAISATYTAQNGRYTKIGRLVTLSFDVSISAISSQGSSIAYIAGSPFNNPSTQDYDYAGTFGQRTAISSSTVAMSCIKHSTNTAILIRQHDDFRENVDDNWEVGTMRGSITFEVA